MVLPPLLPEFVSGKPAVPVAGFDPTAGVPVPPSPPDGPGGVAGGLLAPAANMEWSSRFSS
jgi:hypothetical protein